MPVTVLSEHRASNGRFAPGRSGNPTGRPKGARNRITLLAEAVLEENSEGLTQKAVGDAIGGDAGTLRFLLGRLVPPASADQPVALGLAPGEERDPEAILTKTVRAMADGEITPKQALQIGRLIAIIARLKKAVRLSSPERSSQQPKPAPVSDLYSAIPLPLAGEGGDPARSDGEGEGSRPASHTPAAPLTPAPSRKREREMPPVSDLYFSAQNASCAPRSDLFSTTAIALAPGMAALRGVESPRAALPI
jgi:hypothetical protein